MTAVVQLFNIWTCCYRWDVLSKTIAAMPVAIAPRATIDPLRSRTKWLNLVGRIINRITMPKMNTTIIIAVAVAAAAAIISMDRHRHHHHHIGVVVVVVMMIPVQRTVATVKWTVETALVEAIEIVGRPNIKRVMYRTVQSRSTIARSEWTVGQSGTVSMRYSSWRTVEIHCRITYRAPGFQTWDSSVPLPYSWHGDCRSSIGNNCCSWICGQISVQSMRGTERSSRSKFVHCTRWNGWRRWMWRRLHQRHHHRRHWVVVHCPCNYHHCHMSHRRKRVASAQTLASHRICTV